MNIWRTTASAALLLAACMLASVSCARESAARDAFSSNENVLAGLHVSRRIEPQLSVETVYRRCRAIGTSDAAIPVSLCGGPESDTPAAQVLAVAARAATAIQSKANPEAFHSAALIDLIWGDSGKSLNRSISYLRAAAKLQNNRASTLVDLSAALLVRAGHTQESGDLVEATEQANRALAMQPRNPAARFNLALALEKLNLTNQAAAARLAYAALDSSSRWAVEMRQQPNSAMLTDSAHLQPNATRAEVDAYVARTPKDARELGWDHALGAWGAAWLQHDSASARDQLRFAATIAAALELHGRDPTLADAVHVIQKAQGQRLLETLAIAHRAYAQGRALYNAGNYPASGELFALAVDHSSRSPSLLRWAQLHLAATLIYRGQVNRGEHMLREVVSQTDTTRAPALAARGRWMIGTTLLRMGRYEAARDAFKSAATLFGRAGERENVGAMQSLVADAEFRLGDNAVGFGTMRVALATLRPYQASLWTHNLLAVAAGAANADNHPLAALQLASEDVAISRQIREPMYLAESRLARARLLIDHGDNLRAHVDLDAARRTIDSLPNGLARRWFTADMQFDEALESLRRNPKRAIVALDSVIVFFASVHNSLRILPALISRADALLGNGDPALAIDDLDRASELLANEDAAIRAAPFRASLLDAARPVFDHLAMLYADAGRPRDALAVLERGRAFVTPLGKPKGPITNRLGVPHGVIVIEYALVGDTLIALTVKDTSVTLHRISVSRAVFLHTADQARMVLETDAFNRATLPQLSSLYDWLIRPIKPELGAEGTPIVFIADGDVAAIPFPALFDERSKSYLIESHPLRFEPSLRDAQAHRLAPLPSNVRVLVIGDPGFDRRVFPSLDPLPGAHDEATMVRNEYRDATTLFGGAATPTAMESALPHAELVHYAGHAIVDDAYPERSFLVLAAVRRDPRGAMSGQSILDASHIRDLDLHRVRLVVLSACEALAAHEGRSGGLAGLSGAFLAAGARGVVGSQWRVDDQSTRTLMHDFHYAYHRSGDGASALQSAQLRMIRSPDPALSSPSAWAGFRYAGQ